MVFTFLNRWRKSKESFKCKLFEIQISESINKVLLEYSHNISCIYCLWFSSVQFSGSVMSNSLQPHEPQHARPPCASPTPRVYSNSCASSRWCHPAISSSVFPFSSLPQSLPASGSFTMSQLFTWGGQSIGVSASASVLPRSLVTFML